MAPSATLHSDAEQLGAEAAPAGAADDSDGPMQLEEDMDAESRG